MSHVVFVHFLTISAKGTYEVHVRMKYGASMLKLKATYAKCIGVPANTLRFFFNGGPIGDEDTPYSLKLEDHDIIEAVPVKQ